MSPEHQRMAIALACGYTLRFTDFEIIVTAPAGFKCHPHLSSSEARYYEETEIYRSMCDVRLLNEKGAHIERTRRLFEDTRYPFPNFPLDLNEMAEAENTLSSEQRGDFINHLANICKDNSDGPATAIGKSFFATASQRAEAFLKTLGLWKEGA